MGATSREQFVQQVLDVMHSKFPVAKVARAGEPFTVHINGQSAPLENLYRSCSLQPERTNEFIEQWVLEIVRAGEGLPDQHAKYEELSDRILPMVVPEDARTRPGEQVLSQPLVPGLMVTYAVDNPRSLMYISEATRKRWNVDPEALHEQAIENLVSRSHSIAAHAAQDPDGSINLILFQTMDGFDASRLLLPTLHERLREHLGSPFLAGVPNRDILLCFRDDAETIDRVRKQIEHDHQEMPHPVTNLLLQVTADGIAPY